jgi:hypothetical protein
MNYQVVDLKICYRNTETERRDMQLTVLLDESDEYTMISFISIYKKYVESDDVLAKIHHGQLKIVKNMIY